MVLTGRVGKGPDGGTGRPGSGLRPPALRRALVHLRGPTPGAAGTPFPSRGAARRPPFSRAPERDAWTRPRSTEQAAADRRAPGRGACAAWRVTAASSWARQGAELRGGLRARRPQRASSPGTPGPGGSEAGLVRAAGPVGRFSSRLRGSIGAPGGSRWRSWAPARGDGRRAGAGRLSAGIRNSGVPSLVATGRPLRAVLSGPGAPSDPQPTSPLT